MALLFFLFVCFLFFFSQATRCCYTCFNIVNFSVSDNTSFKFIFIHFQMIEQTKDKCNFLHSFNEDLSVTFSISGSEIFLLQLTNFKCYDV